MPSSLTDVRGSEGRHGPDQDMDEVRFPLRALAEGRSQE
jgi:hypothetical protein